jgi:hypothetical protein
MDLSENASHSNDTQFRLAAVIYYAVLLAGFVVGLYGLISLLSLASSEVERNAHILGVFI